jgi:uncharacterized protein with FMN-binding domain
VSTTSRLTVRGLLNRTGLFGASILLAALLVVGFRAPDEVALDGAGSGTTSGSGAGSGTGSTGTTSGSGATTGAGITSGSGATTGSGAGATAPAATDSTAATSADGSKTVTGPLESTRYGPVQVEVTIASGQIVAVTAVELPSGGRSGSISMYAAPILAGEAVTAQSASIDTVSGATYTSRAYATSLQAALDQAGV